MLVEQDKKDTKKRMNTYAFRKRSIENYTLKRDRKRVEDAMKKRKQSFLKRNCVDVESILHNATRKDTSKQKKHQDWQKQQEQE